MSDRAVIVYLMFSAFTCVTTRLAVVRGVITPSLRASLVVGGLLLLSVLAIFVATAVQNNRLLRVAGWPMAALMGAFVAIALSDREHLWLFFGGLLLFGLLSLLSVFLRERQIVRQELDDRGHEPP